MTKLYAVTDTNQFKKNHEYSISSINFVSTSTARPAMVGALKKSAGWKVNGETCPDPGKELYTQQRISAQFK